MTRRIQFLSLVVFLLLLMFVALPPRPPRPVNATPSAPVAPPHEVQALPGNKFTTRLTPHGGGQRWNGMTDPAVLTVLEWINGAKAAR